MKRVEITYRSNIKELEKLNARLERAEKTYEKKLAAAQKYGVAEMANEEHSEWLKTVPSQDGWITDKEAIKKNGAWYDLTNAEWDLEDIKRQIANAEKRYEKSEKAVEAYYKELEEEQDLKKKEELFKLEFEKEQKEWAKDGITLNGRYYGITPNGRKFWIERNHGWTERSLHCFTLTLTNDEGIAYAVFTSGEFWRAYGVVRKS